MHFPTPILLVLLMCAAQLLSAQGGQDWKAEGLRLIQEGKYRQALQGLLENVQQHPTDPGALVDIGVCYYYCNNLIEAENYLYQSFRAKTDPPPDVYYYLAKVNHAKLEFEIAVDFYKKYLRKISEGHSLRASVKDDIRRCATGIGVRRVPAAAAVVNLGEEVNSADDDFRPLLSPSTQERIYFASNKKVGGAAPDTESDIFYTDLVDGDWQKPRPINRFINSSQHEVPQGFGEGGGMLYFFRGNGLDRGQLLVDTFRENAVERSLTFTTLNSPLQTGDGDTDPFFFNDSILLFASRRAGGYGGLDLYFTMLAHGEWSVPQNLGPAINTAYDETSPFLAADGRSLYFSTNNPRLSIGGLDLVKSKYLDQQQQWSQPGNLGIPLNSAGDEVHFLLTPGGGRAFFSSSRKDGFGKRDLYVALFEAALSEQKKRSLPLAFPMVPSFQASLAHASEQTGMAPDRLLEEMETLELKPLAFSPNSPFPNATAWELDLLTAVLKKYPETRLTLAAHSAREQTDVQTAMTTLRKLEAYLLAAGAPLSNISLLWTGANYPVRTEDLAENMRLEAFIANPEALPIEVVYQKTPPAAATAVFFKNAMQQLFYQAMVPLPGDGGKALLDDLFSKYPDGMVSFHPSTGQYFFNLGAYLTFASARQWVADLAKNGFPEATVSVRLKGWPLSRDEAALHTGEYPDLLNFIQH